MEGFCEVCGDTGGATRMVLCENADRGCLGGIHLYCCVPLLAEPPADAWFCSECEAARATAESRRKAAAKYRAAQHAAALAARKKEREVRRRERHARRQQRREEARRQQQQQAAASLQAKPSNGALHPAEPVKAGAPAVSAPTALRPANQQQAANVPRPASRDTLAMLFEALGKGDEEATKRQAADMSRMVDGTTRRLQRTISEREQRERQLREQLALDSCMRTGHLMAFALELPLLHQAGSFLANVLSYAIPGNAQWSAATARLEPLLLLSRAGQQPTPRLLSMDELGISQKQAHSEASMLLALGQGPPAQQAHTASSWLALWEELSRGRQAVSIPVPAVTPGSAGGSSGGAGSDDIADGLHLALVPNLWDPASMTLFGLLAVPVRSLQRPSAKAAQRPARGILRVKPAPAAVAQGGDAAQPAAEAPSRRRALSWADGAIDDVPGPDSAVALELALGSHYALAQQGAAQAPPPARLPSSSAATAPAASVPLPLEGMRIALVGFSKFHERTTRMLTDLRHLGAFTHTINQVVLADVVCVHPDVWARPNERQAAFPLGLAHLLATCGARIYVDSSFAVLYELVRLQRPLKGVEWLAGNLGLLFPAGLIVVLDAPSLQRMRPEDLSLVLSEVQRLAAAAEVPRCLWNVVATLSDLGLLQEAATAGVGNAVQNLQIWRHWEQQGIARHMGVEEMSTSSKPGDPLPAVKHAVKSAAVHVARCRLVYLCSLDTEVTRQAEAFDSILSGNVAELIEFLKSK